MEPVPQPPHFDIGYLDQPFNMINGVADLLGDGRVNAIKEPGEDRFTGIPDNPEYRNRDDETDNRIGKRESKINPGCTDKDRKARKPVCPCMLAISNERCAADLVSHPDAELCHGFIPDKPDKCCRCYRPEKRHLLRVEEPVDGNVPGYNSRDQDHQNHENTCKILDPAIPVCEPFRRFPPGQHECEQEWDRSECIAEIVDGIGKQCDASGIIYDDYLEDCSNEQADKRPLDRPDPPLGGENGRIDNTVRVGMTVVSFMVIITIIPVIMSMEMPMIMIVIFMGFMVISMKNHSL
jgi:hypothetical protein